MSKAGRIVATKKKKAKRLRGITIARSKGLCDHVVEVIRRVVSRPRFGFDIVEFPENHLGIGSGFTIKYANDEFRVRVGSYERECNIMVIKESVQHDQLFAFNDHRVYYSQFQITAIPDLKRIGVTIANLIYNHPVWLLTKE